MPRHSFNRAAEQSLALACSTLAGTTFLLSSRVVLRAVR